MIVVDPIELYTTVLGWHIHNGLWELIAGTGVALLPFAAIIIKNLVEARKHQDKADIGVLAFRLSEVELYSAFMVVLLAINPAINLQAKDVVSVQSYCDVQNATPGDKELQRLEERLNATQSGTTFDTNQYQIDTMLDGRIPQMPIVWFFWDWLSSAVTLSAKATLPCQPDMRRMSYELAVSQIKDEQLNDETLMFYRDCWRPSLNRYVRDKPEVPEEFDNIDQDILWAGSRFFLNHPDYYAFYYPKEGLKSFPYEEQRDSARVAPEFSDGRGYPQCDEWWMDDTYGLRGRLLDHVRNDMDSRDRRKQSTWKSFKFHFHRAKGWLMDSRESDDEMLRLVLTSNQEIRHATLTNKYRREGLGGALTDGYAEGVNAIGLSFGGGMDVAKQQYMRTAMPIIRAILLMVITLAMPILFFFSGFRIGPVVTLMLIKFSVIFWAFLFALATWLDNYLLEALSSAGGGSTSGFLMSAAKGEAMDPAVKIVGFVTRMLYYGLPFAFTTMMAWVGVKAGGVAGDINSGNAASSSSMVQDTAVNKVTSNIGK